MLGRVTRTTRDQSTGPLVEISNEVSLQETRTKEERPQEPRPSVPETGEAPIDIG